MEGIMDVVLKLEHIQKFYGKEANLTKAIKDIIFFGVISIFHAHHIAYKYCAVIKSNFKFNSNFPHQKWDSHLEKSIL